MSVLSTLKDDIVARLVAIVADVDIPVHPATTPEQAVFRKEARFISVMPDTADALESQEIGTGGGRPQMVSYVFRIYVGAGASDGTDDAIDQISGILESVDTALRGWTPPSVVGAFPLEMSDGYTRVAAHASGFGMVAGMTYTMDYWRCS